MNKQDFFFCYNRSMMMYLKSKGLRFVICALHEVSEKKFWMFERTEELEKALSEYNN